MQFEQFAQINSFVAEATKISEADQYQKSKAIQELNQSLQTLCQRYQVPNHFVVPKSDGESGGLASLSYSNEKTAASREIDNHDDDV